MKHLLLSFCFSFLFIAYGKGQCSGTWNQITHTSGTQVIAGNSVTVTQIGSVSSISCGLSGYWIGVGSSTGSILYSFGTPVNCFRFLVNATSNVGGNEEKINVKINGVPYAIQASQVICTPCASIPNCANGVLMNLVAGELIPIADDGEAEVIFNTPINTVEVINEQIIGSPQGSIINVFFQGGSVINPDTLIAQYTYDSISCSGLDYDFFDNSVFNVPITGWQWNFGDPASGVNNTSTLQNPSHTFTSPGTYNVQLTVTNANSLTNSITHNLQVVAHTVNAQAGGTATICQGYGTSLNASGGVSYIWQPTAGLSNPNIFNPACNVATTTTYTVIVTDALGCTGTSTVQVQVVTPQLISVTNSHPLICAGDTSWLSASGSGNYIWSPGSSLNTTTGANVIATPTTTTTYTVSGTDINGCSASITTTVGLVDLLDMEVSKTGDIDCNQKSVVLHAGGAQQYSWTPVHLVESPSSPNTNTTHLTETTTFYVTGKLGSCTDTDTITVEVHNKHQNQFFIPTAFSPNYDGINDCFRVITPDLFDEFILKVYNRWGQQVYSTNDPDNCWDGFFQNQKLAQDTYYYYLKAKNNCGPFFQKGDVILVR